MIGRRAAHILRHQRLEQASPLDHQGQALHTQAHQHPHNHAGMAGLAGTARGRQADEVGHEAL